MLTFRLKEIYIKYGFLDLEESEKPRTWGSHPASPPSQWQQSGRAAPFRRQQVLQLDPLPEHPSLRAIVSCHLVTVHHCASLTLSLLLSYMALRSTPGAVEGVPFNGPGCAEEAPRGKTPRTTPFRRSSQCHDKNHCTPTPRADKRATERNQLLIQGPVYAERV